MGQVCGADVEIKAAAVGDGETLQVGGGLVLVEGRIGLTYRPTGRMANELMVRKKKLSHLYRTVRPP